MMNPIATLVEQIELEQLWQTQVTVTRQEFLKVGGTTDTRLYFVEQGTLHVFRLDDGKEQTIRFGYRGDIIAALDSFLTDRPSGLYIQVLKKATLKVIDKQTFKTFVYSTPERLNTWVQLLEGFVVQQMERENDLLITSPVERYERVLERSPHLFQEVPHKYIASYLRMSPETLSRLQKS